MIFFGYLAIFIYIFILIYVIGPAVQAKSDTETSRKIIHTLLFAVWILIDIFFKNTIHQILIAVLFIIINAISYKFKLFKSVERQDENHLGTVYFAIVIALMYTVAYFRPVYYPHTGIATFCLTFGDGFASIVGRRLKTKTIRKGKTLGGFAGCFIASFISLLFFRMFYFRQISVIGLISLALLTAIAELAGNGLDNFSIVFSVFPVSILLSSDTGGEALFALLIAEAIFMIVFFTGAIDYWGSLLSMVIVFSFSYFGGRFALIYLLATYFTIFFIALYKKIFLKKHKKEKGRNFYQILINGGAGLLFMFLYGNKKEIAYLLISIIAIGGCFIDSLSSDLGVLSRKPPLDILRGKRISRGLSGGISLLGTAGALVGAFLIALSSYIGLEIDRKTAVLMFLMIFLQTVLDSMMGSLLQVKYRCVNCGKITEEKNHCGCQCAVDSGVSWIDNNVVNLFSSLIITAAAAWLLLRVNGVWIF